MASKQQESLKAAWVYNIAGYKKTLTTANSNIIEGNEAYGKINESHHIHMHSYYIYTYIYIWIASLLPTKKK